jgi:hypothetical protein
MRTKNLGWIAVAAAAAMLSPGARADFSFSNINLSDYNTLIKEFSADSLYSSVTPASSLGGLGGFELGVVALTMNAPDTQALIQRDSPSTNFNGKLYNGGGLARVGLPFGLTGELMYVPKIKAGNAKIGRWGIAAQWTATDSVLEDLPFNLAAKAYYTKTSLAYTQNISNSSTGGISVPANLSLDDKIWGVEALASYKIAVIEPYAGVGYVKAKGTLTVDAAGNATIFDPSLAALLGITSTSFVKSLDSSPSSMVLKAGLDLRLAFFTLGAEYANAFNKNALMGRVSFRF